MSEVKMDYVNKMILAPMVRVGTLPTRLLALDFGADLVYCEEIIDHKMLQCTRTENVMLGTIDYVMNDGTVVFRTCAKEKGKVVFQVGTCDAQRAVQVAKMLENDVAAFDVNMGCPKEFSIKGGMGAALLSQPEKVKEILTALVKEVNVPITCKIRLLPTLEETIAFAKMAESCGIVAIGVHGRLKEERPRHANNNTAIREVAMALKIPVIANGGSKEIKCFEDIEKFRLDSGAGSVMIARAAEWNTSIFSHKGLLPVTDMVKAYLKYAIDYDNPWGNTKYCVQQYMREAMESEHGQALKSSASAKDIYKIWDMQDYQRQVLEERKEGDVTVKRRKLDNGKTLIEKSICVERKTFRKAVAPKVLLNNYLKDNGKMPPKYHTTQDGRIFYCTLEVGDTCYSSPLGDKSKRWAEQGAALLCLQELGQAVDVKTCDDDTHRRKTPHKTNGEQL